MSNKHIEELLQQCIAAFDSGISPEECLAAYPEARTELEPLFRQAISLRVAFAASPRAEFRQHARERVLFMAGRDVSAAFSARPDPEFVKDARQRFIRAAGAEAQEALRAVPPPRLPFWMNTRRRLIEQAAATSRPVARPVGGIFALRTGLSMAVVVLAMAVAGLAYMVGFNATPASNAEFAKFEQDLAELQRDQQNGVLITEERLDQLTAQVTKIAEQPQVNQKLPELINRQKDVINAAANDGLLAPELAQAQTQQLEQAQTKAELRLSATRAEDPTATAQAPTSTPTSQAGAATTTTAVPATPTPAVTPPAPGVALEDGQIRVSASDNFGGKSWKTVEFANMSFDIPDNWKIVGVILDRGEYGFGLIDVSNLIIQAGSDGEIIVNVSTGRINVFTGGKQFTLRVGGAGERFISQSELEAEAGVLIGDLRRLMDTFEPAGALIPVTPTATPTTPPATSTPAPPTATQPPATSTSTPPPSATP